MDYAKKYLKYKDKATQDKFNKLVNELRMDMTLESAISLALTEMRAERMKSGGRVNLENGGIYDIPPVFEGNIFSTNLDKAVKFNLDGETIYLNPDFFKMFMGPFMNSPEKLKKRKDDLKQEIRRSQKSIKVATGGLIDKPLGAGGKKSGPPPKKGPSSKGLNIKGNTVKTV